MIQTLFAIDLMLLESSQKSAKEVEQFQAIQEHEWQTKESAAWLVLLLSCRLQQRSQLFFGGEHNQYLETSLASLRDERRTR